MVEEDSLGIAEFAFLFHPTLLLASLWLALRKGERRKWKSSETLSFPDRREERRERQEAKRHVLKVPRCSQFVHLLLQSLFYSYVRVPIF